jgi:HPt (histidine-containing phosphotransfer) domain-containing protein
MSNESLKEQLARHRATFVASLPARREALERAVAAFCVGDLVAPQTIESALHRLAGSAGVHGLDALSNAALAALTRFGSEADAATLAGWPEMAALRAALDAASGAAP